MIGPPSKNWIWLIGVAALGWAATGYATTDETGSAPLVGGQDAPPPSVTGPVVRVVLTCKVTSDRTLDQCVVKEETPAGHGLGAAALRMSHDVKIKPETFSPEMIGSTIDIPIRFVQEPDGDGVATMPM